MVKVTSTRKEWHWKSIYEQQQQQPHMYIRCNKCAMYVCVCVCENEIQRVNESERRWYRELCWRKIFSRLGYCIKFTPLSFMTFEKYHNIMPFLSFYYVILFITPNHRTILRGANCGGTERNPRCTVDVGVVVVVFVVTPLSTLPSTLPPHIISFGDRKNYIRAQIWKFRKLLISTMDGVWPRIMSAHDVREAKGKRKECEENDGWKEEREKHDHIVSSAFECQHIQCHS